MEIQFVNISELGVANKLYRAFGLLNAKESCTTLKAELPDTHHNYSSPFKAFRRLSYINELIDQEALRADIIAAGRRTLGVCSFQPRISPDGPSRDFAEVAYWHRELDPHTALDVGMQVMRHLLTPLPGDYEFESRWTVTMPGDEVKAEVMRQSGMNPVAEPQIYPNVAGSTNGPRQLWIMPL